MALSYSKWLRLFIYGGFVLILFSLYYNYRIAKLFLTQTEFEKQSLQGVLVEEDQLLRNQNELWDIIKELKDKDSRYFPIVMEEQNRDLKIPVGKDDNYAILVRQATKKSIFVFLNYFICFLLFSLGFLPFFWVTDGSKLKFFGQEMLGFLVMSSLMLTFRYFLN